MPIEHSTMSPTITGSSPGGSGEGESETALMIESIEGGKNMGCGSAEGPKPQDGLAFNVGSLKAPRLRAKSTVDHLQSNIKACSGILAGPYAAARWSSGSTGRGLTSRGAEDVDERRVCRTAPGAPPGAVSQLWLAWRLASVSVDEDSVQEAGETHIEDWVPAQSPSVRFPIALGCARRTPGSRGGGCAFP